jgi:hypothetical protein
MADPNLSRMSLLSNVATLEWALAGKLLLNFMSFEHEAYMALHLPRGCYGSILYHAASV